MKMKMEEEGAGSTRVGGEDYGDGRRDRDHEHQQQPFSPPFAPHCTDFLSILTSEVEPSDPEFDAATASSSKGLT